MFVPSACLLLLPQPLFPPPFRAPLRTAPPSSPAPIPRIPPSIAWFPVDRNLVSVWDCFVFELVDPDDPEDPPNLS